MSTSVSIGDDLKSYLSSSQPKKSGLVGNIFNNGPSKSWLYSPLGSSEPDDSNAAHDNSHNGYFSNLFGRNQPEPDNSSWLPALVSYRFY